MADDTKGIKGFSQQQDVVEQDTESSKKSTAAIKEETRAIEAHTRALKADHKNRENFGRLMKQQETLYEKAAAGFNNMTSGLFSFETQLDSAKRSFQGFTGNLAQASAISSVYQRKLEAMRKGQQNFTQTLVATTNNTSEAMDKSQQYVTAVHDSYVSAHKIAGEFRVEVGAMEKAVDDLNARFSTQIVASGDAKGAIEGMRREAFLLSRFLGVEMSEVMETWQERLDQSIKTLDEARIETAAVAQASDQYAQELQKLGDRFMKTGNIGKKEFLDMVRSVGKELRTGTIDAAGYANALKGLLVEGKKNLLTVNEQRGAAEGMKKMLAETFSISGKGAVFGVEVAKKMIGQWDDLSNIQNEQLRGRLEMVKKNFADAPETQQLRAVMNVLKGSSAGSAEALRQMANMMGVELNREFIAKFTDGNMVQADLLMRQIKSGEMAQDFEKKAVKEAEAGRDGQTAVWKKSMEDFVKAAHTPKDLEYKAVAVTEQIRNKLFEYVKMFPVVIMAAQAGGSILNRVLGGGARGAGGLLGGSRAAQGGGILARLLGVGGAGGAAKGAAAFLGPVAAVAGAGAAGFMAGRGLDKLVGEIAENLPGSEDRSRKYGKDLSLSSALGSTEGGRTVMELFMWDPDTDKTNAKLKKQLAETVRIEGKELQRRKKEVRDNDKRMKELQELGNMKTKLEEDELKLLKERNKQLKGSIKHITKRERREKAQESKRYRAERSARMGEWMKKVQFTGKETPAEIAKMLLRGQKNFGGAMGETRQLGVHHMTGDIGQAFTQNLANLPKEIQEKFAAAGGADAIKKAVSKYALGVRLGKNFEETGAAETKTLKAEWAERRKSQPGTERWGGGALSGEAMDKYQKETQQSVNLSVSTTSGDDDAQAQTLKRNARGQIIFSTPAQKVVLEGEQVGATFGEATKKPPG